MKIKFLYFILFFFCSCSVIIKTASEKTLTGRVLMYGTQYPLSVHVDIYHDTEKIISTKSDNSGYFQFPFYNKYRKGLSLIIYKNRNDDTSKLTKYGKTLTICEKDTFRIDRLSLKDTIILNATKCSWLTIEH